VRGVSRPGRFRTQPPPSSTPRKRRYVGPIRSKMVLASVVLRLWGGSMSDVTSILSAIEQGDPQAASQLLPLVYDELRRLAAQKMAQEASGQTLQATALVHEAYLRLVGEEESRHWSSRG